MYVSKRRHFILDSYAIAIHVAWKTDRLQFHLCGKKVMNDQLERIDFISTVLIIRHLVQVDDQHPLSSSRIMKNSGREFRQVQFRLLQETVHHLIAVL